MKIKLCNYILFYGEQGKDKTFTVEFNPGYTAIVGPNGSGKTTILKQIYDYCKKNSDKYEAVRFDNLTDGSNRKFSEFLITDRADMIASIMTQSEGQGIMTNLGDFASRCGQATRSCLKDKKNLVILIDGVDSGTSIDNIYVFRNHFCNTIINHCSNENITVYIIATANNYAMVNNGVDCVIGFNGRHRGFGSYNAFESFILKNSEDYERLKNHTI